MIYIEKNRVNSVVLTLTESSRLSDPYFLFEFKNEFILGSTGLLFSTQDISGYPNRYNQFLLVENASGSTSGGNDVALNLIAGQYEYSVYESSEPTLSISDTTGVVLEKGRMVVVGLDGITTGTTGVINSVYI